MPLRAGIMKYDGVPDDQDRRDQDYRRPDDHRSPRQGVDRGDEGETGPDVDLDQHLEVAD